jgi:rhodanese-related sulfurtransferase
LEGGLEAWKRAGYEVFRDVNSYAKAFGELVEFRRHTPSLSAQELAALIENKANIRILDVRRPDEYATMNIPGSISVPGAELVLRAGHVAPDGETTIVVNCAGRTRSIIGTQSLINAGIANKVVALRNGTIGWTLASQQLEHGADRHGEMGPLEGAKARAREVAYRAGVRHLRPEEAATLTRATDRTLYRFDVRASDEYAAGHLKGFRHYPGGQLVQEIDMAAPVRGARILLTDSLGGRRPGSHRWAGRFTCSKADTINLSRPARRKCCRGRIRRIVTGVPMKAPMRPQARCKPISIGNTAWSSSCGATRRMDFS